MRPIGPLTALCISAACATLLLVLFFPLPGDIAAGHVAEAPLLRDSTWALVTPAAAKPSLEGGWGVGAPSRQKISRAAESH